MFLLQKPVLVAGLASLLAGASGVAMGCSSCGCNLGSDWVSQGITTQSGFSLDLRHDNVDQSELRIGHRKAGAQDIANARGAGDEIEQRTRNRYTTLTLNYNPDRVWGFSLQMPWVLRTHSTDDAGSMLYSRSNELGDIKLITRYQGFADLPNVGVIAGLKLPTGAFHDTFTGSTDLLDRSLQPGTGTTDAIYGVYGSGALNKDLDWFSQAVAQTPLQARQDYRPGTSMGVNLGLRYMSAGAVMPQIQLNGISKQRDQDAGAGVAGTGGRLLFITPGLGFTITRQLSGFANVQLPVYQDVNELQLTSRANYSVGLHYRFR